MSFSEPPEARKPSNEGGTSPDESSSEATSDAKDVVLVHGVTDDGEGLKVLRHREGRLEAGAARPLKHGQPISGEVVRLVPRREFPLLCDVQVAMPSPAQEGRPAAVSRKGPPKVATQRYRDNWDAIWNRSSGGQKVLN